MDSPKPSYRFRKGVRCVLLRIWLTFLLLLASFSFSFCGFLAIWIGNFSVPRADSVRAQCKIVSSSVDLRSSKVCELGLLNYKAKNIFYPLERTRFRCRYDYYWTSVFKVEYRENSSGQIFLASAEAPNEALPLNCRPGFGAAWLTKNKFKVNETYSCGYTPGVSKVDIYADSLFNCQAADPSTLEILRRLFVLLTKSTPPSFYDTGGFKSIFQGAGAGIAAGILSAILLVSLVKFLRWLGHASARCWNAAKLHIATHGVRIRRICFLIAYVSTMAWFTLQYGKFLGLSEFFISSRLGEKPMKR